MSAARYPWDSVVSFLHHRVLQPWTGKTLLEIGCGIGPNLWFAAREGFHVTGIETSEDYATAARNRLTDDGLSSIIFRQSFSHPYPCADCTFDVVIDRGGLTCGTYADARTAIAEIARVIKPGGWFHFNPYSSLGNRVPVTLYDRDHVMAAIGPEWTIEKLTHVLQTEDNGPIHAEWRVELQRSPVKIEV